MKPYIDWNIIAIAGYAVWSVMIVAKYGKTLWKVYDGSALNIDANTEIEDTTSDVPKLNLSTNPKRAL